MSPIRDPWSAERFAAALANNEFFLVYQPEIDVASNAFVGVEALLRWRIGPATVLTPEHFLADLESTGLIVDVGAWALRTACRQGRRWYDRGYRFAVSVNVSSAQLRSPDFVELVERVLAITTIDPRSLILEYSYETLERSGAPAVLADLRRLGVRAAVDNFRSGRSLIADVGRWQLDVVKVGPGYFGGDGESQDALRALVAEAKSMGVVLAAAGVEDRDQRRRLALDEVSSAQGYLFSEPREAAEIDHLLEDFIILSGESPFRGDRRTFGDTFVDPTIYSTLRGADYVARAVQAVEDLEAEVQDLISPEVALRFLNETVPGFAEWYVVEFCETPGEFQRFQTRRITCAGKDPTHRTCCEREFSHEVPHYDQAFAEMVLSGSRFQATSDGRFLMGVIHLDESPYAILTMVAPKQALYDENDASAHRTVCAFVDQTIQRVSVQRDARRAIRRTQRIARQLHELLATSLTTTRLRTNLDLASTLVTSAASVLDADVAVLTIDGQGGEPFYAVARNSGEVRAERGVPDEAFRWEYPLDPLDHDRWRDDGWLIQPILEGRSIERGVLAVRRDGADFNDEDRSVLELLGELTGAAVGSYELGRIVEQNEIRLRSLVDSAPVGLIDIGLSGNVWWWNESASRTLGWPRYQVDQTPAVAFPPSIAGEIASLCDEVSRGIADTSRDFGGVEVGGRLRVLTATATVLAGVAGGEPSVLLLIHDVTDHHEMQTELRHAHAMELRGRIASNIAHDFNNLLTLITGYGELLAHTVADMPAATHLVRDIQSTAARASLLTSQLQAIGRARARQAEVFSVADIVTSNTRIIAPVLGALISLKTDIDYDETFVNADPDQFEQTLLNLVVNARDAMVAGGTLSLGVHREILETATVFGGRHLDAGPYVHVRVSDTGTGMDEVTMARCFEPLFTTKGPHRGTGLGLPAARRFADESGGAIVVTSEVGVGTTFDLWLPAVAAEHEEPESPIPVDVGPPGGPARILLVEDDDVQRHLMRQVLSRSGHDVVTAESGERALDVVAESSYRFDLLVSDVLMGGIDGVELAERLLATESVDAILLTSGTESAAILERLDGAPSTFLPKPFRPSDLVVAVDELWSRVASAESR